MKRHLLRLFLTLGFAGAVLAQGSVTMSPPVLRSTAEGVTFTARFSDFSPGSEYRIGVGTTGDKINNLQLELLRGDAARPVPMSTFTQGHTAQWFQVNEIVMNGFVLLGPEVPGPGEEIVLKASVPRSEADRLQKMFVIVAKKYGADVWYIMDGSEMDKSYW